MTVPLNVQPFRPKGKSSTVGV